MIQIGTEGGFLPAPVVIPSTPVGYDYNRRSIVVLNVLNKGLFLQPAERADIIIDFSSVPAGSKLILYNDAPAPVPGFDPRYDYYTGNPDQRAERRRALDPGGLRPQHPDHHAVPGGSGDGRHTLQSGGAAEYGNRIAGSLCCIPGCAHRAGIGIRAHLRDDIRRYVCENPGLLPDLQPGHTWPSVRHSGVSPSRPEARATPPLPPLPLPAAAAQALLQQPPSRAAWSPTLH